jgi:hypothetical protein
MVFNESDRRNFLQEIFKRDCLKKDRVMKNEETETSDRKTE